MTLTTPLRRQKFYIKVCKGIIFDNATEYKLDLFAPRGGVFEPSLALALIRNDNVWNHFERLMEWAKAQDEKEPVNLLYEFLTERGFCGSNN